MSTISLRCHLHIGQQTQVVGESSLLIHGAKAFSLLVALQHLHKRNGYRLNYGAQRQMVVVLQS
jgi:hypothetical protein